MENNKKRRISFNFFDVIIILLVVVLAAGFVYYQSRNRSSGGSFGTGTVRYQVEINNLKSEMTDLISVGDTIVDKIKKQEMGTVVAIDVYPQKREAVDMTTGNTRYTEVPDTYVALLTLETDCKNTDDALTAPSGYVVRVGTSVSALGPGYGGGGYVVNILREDEQDGQTTEEERKIDEALANAPDNDLAAAAQDDMLVNSDRANAAKKTDEMLSGSDSSATDSDTENESATDGEADESTAGVAASGGTDEDTVNDDAENDTGDDGSDQTEGQPAGISGMTGGNGNTEAGR